MRALTFLGKRRRAFMTEKAMGQFVAYVAALAVNVVRIVVDNSGLSPHGTVTAEKDELLPVGNADQDRSA